MEFRHTCNFGSPHRTRTAPLHILIRPHRTSHRTLCGAVRGCPVEMGKLSCEKLPGCSFAAGVCTPISPSSPPVPQAPSGVFPPDLLAEYPFLRHVVQIDWPLLCVRLVLGFGCLFLLMVLRKAHKLLGLLLECVCLYLSNILLRWKSRLLRNRNSLELDN
ncbi:hypothetical protein Fcan01_27746 [Folsomia candida]|uniref:Uncharacterized protein n=1 Tax=Folsomia candida TaxID=158441 RepID=A0A226CVS6_FOLCA|nr:hypothetical protein Fcan01_27746 [Folsomia candida]